jgi:DNA-binding transcriptional ArsR family regulator
MASDLLSKIHEEIDERLRELRPLLVEYEELLVAADALVAEDRDDSLVEPAKVTPTKRARRSARVGSPRRASAAGAIKRAATGKLDTAVDGGKDGEAVKRVARTAGRGADTPAGAGSKEKPARAERGVARETILAALEHGSHTVGELAVVTAMSGPSINGHLRRLVGEGVVAKTEREGKTAWSLSDVAA